MSVPLHEVISTYHVRTNPCFSKKKMSEQVLSNCQFHQVTLGVVSTHTLRNNVVDVKVFFPLKSPVKGHSKVNKLPIAPLVGRGEITGKLGARGRVIVVETHRLVVEPFYYIQHIADST